MLSAEAKKVAEKACELYAEKLRQSLEQEHHGRFICIEPKSGDFFLGDTFDDAVNQAIDAHRVRLTHTLRIGYAAALHLGGINQ
jgi:hypothetical protein